MERDRDVEAARVLAELDLDWAGWFDLWHTHVDWDGAGDEDPELRRRFAGVLIEVHRGLCERLAGRDDVQTWLWFPKDDAGSDSVYVHTPNPNSAYPVRFEEVAWGGEPPAFLAGLFDARELEFGYARTRHGESYYLRPAAR